MRTSGNLLLPGLKPLIDGRRINYMAEKLGVDETLLSRVVKCERGANLALAMRLAKYFDTTIEALVKADQHVSA